MHETTLKAWLKKEDCNEVQRKIIFKLWNTLMIWGSWDGYYSVAEIAKGMKVSPSTISTHVKKFKKHFPEAYERIQEKRQSAKKSTTRLARSLQSPVSYDPSMDEYVKEKF